MQNLKMKTLFVHDMVHNNPGMRTYKSGFNDPTFMKLRGYDGKVFDLQQCAQVALTWQELDRLNPDREPVYPVQSKEYQWVMAKQQELEALYAEIDQAGLDVMFMMDMIVLPKRLLKIYPEILNEAGKIDIRKPKMKQVLDVLFDEIFAEFPQVKGIYVRYGETYVGDRFGTPCHTGNNPIIEGQEAYHLFLIDYLKEKVCRQYKRDIYYRTWGFGDFQFDPEAYLRISNAIEPDPHFYFCIKHTAGDFHRTYRFNQSLNVGRHKQVVEVQLAREYEGKGAYPNYISDGVINGYEEYKNLMRTDEKQCLRDVVFQPDSLICGIWTWTRGGGWGGPYITENDEDPAHDLETNGSELWPDVNAYVLTHWCKNPAYSDKHYAVEYAREILGFSSADAELFYEILIKSAHAVLLGRGCNTEAYPCDMFWTRDQNVEYSRIVNNIRKAMEADSTDLLLAEKRESVDEWHRMVEIAESMTDRSAAQNYILTTCRYGYYLFSIFETIYRANVYAMMGHHSEEVEKAVSQYDVLWQKWRELYDSEPCCPTLYAKEDAPIDLIGYDWNRGLDSAINPLRDLDENGMIKAENRVEVAEYNAWGLTGAALN